MRRVRAKNLKPGMILMDDGREKVIEFVKPYPGKFKDIFDISVEFFGYRAGGFFLRKDEFVTIVRRLGEPIIIP
jgi:hypothetical protein